MTRAIRTRFAFVVAVASAGCGGGPDACTPGARMACTCAGGGAGSQVCAGDGSGFGACTGCPASSDLAGLADLRSVADLASVPDLGTPDLAMPIRRCPIW